QAKRRSFWERRTAEGRRHSIMLRSAVYSFAIEDDCVIVGLGASMLLRGLSRVLKVLTIAPVEVRIRRVMESGTSTQPAPIQPEAAIEMVRARDREVAGYLRYLF